MDRVTPEKYNILEEKIKVRSFQTHTLKPSKENMESLKTIQKIILYYENQLLTLDEVLTRVLEHYNEYVQYK
jgi:hypothetical protein